MPLVVFPQVQDEPGKAAVTGLLMLTVLQHPPQRAEGLSPFLSTGTNSTKTLLTKPGYSHAAKLLHTIQQTIEQLIKEESQPREQFRIPENVNYLTTLSQSFLCGSHGDPTAFWKAVRWLNGYSQKRQGEDLYTHFNT